MDLLEIGKLLKEERLRQGVTLEAVAKLTRIGTSALTAIEEGDERALPNPVYIKGFVKNYARFLKLDQNVVDNALQDVRFTSGNAMWSPGQNLPVRPRLFPVWQASVAALLLIVLVGGGGTLYLLRTGDTNVSDLPPGVQATPSDGVAKPAWQPAPLALQDQAPLQSVPMEPPPPPGSLPSEPTNLEQTGAREAPETLTQDPPPTPTVRQDMNLQKADLDNMRLTLRPGSLRADFEIRNLSNDLISGSISISFISRDNRTVPALGNEEIPRFTIRNFRPVTTRLHLPPDMNLEDVVRVQFVVTDLDGTDILVRTYPVGQG